MRACLDVDIVVKATMFDGWMEPLGYKLDNKSTMFLRVPKGPFALRVISQLGADVLVHLDGKHLLATAIPKGIQYLERDADGKPFYFGAQGGTSDPDLPTGASRDGTTGDGVSVPVDRTIGDAERQAPMVVPSGQGLLFVVARFADDPTNEGSQPPRQEYEMAFQLQAPEDHDRSLSGSLSQMVEPPLPPDPDDIVKMTPSNHPTFVCSCKSHSH